MGNVWKFLLVEVMSDGDAVKMLNSLLSKNENGR